MIAVDLRFRNVPSTAPLQEDRYDQLRVGCSGAYPEQPDGSKWVDCAPRTSQTSPFGMARRATSVGDFERLTPRVSSTSASSESGANIAAFAKCSVN